MKTLRTLVASLRFRFGLWVAGLLLVVLLGFGSFIYTMMARSLYASLDASLQLNGSQAVAAAEVEDGRLDLPTSFFEEPENADFRTRGFMLRLLKPDGRILREYGVYEELPITTESLTAAEQQQATYASLIDPATQTSVRIYTVPIENDNETIGIMQVGQSTVPIQDTLKRLRNAMLIGVPLLMVIAGGSGYFLATRALAPIDRITATARRISAEDLSARLDLPTTNDELGRLSTTLDAMLARLDEFFRRERQFTADASHELRTPLAAMQVITHTMAQKRRSAEEYEAAMGDLGEEIDRLGTLAGQLLLLARGEGKETTPLETVDVAALLTDIINSLHPAAEVKGLEMTCLVPDELRMMGDADSLIRLFVNLVDNAIKYTDKGRITVVAEGLLAGAIQVSITDTGSGIPAEAIPHIFDRFYRVEKSRTTQGTGLGLAIAQSIAKAHHGMIEVRSAIGQGSTFVVLLGGKAD